jgi:hypothetical protein
MFKEVNIQSLIQTGLLSIEKRSSKFPLLLKEGWPNHFLFIIKILRSAGVVDSLSNISILSFESISCLKEFDFTCQQKYQKPTKPTNPVVIYGLQMLDNHLSQPPLLQKGEETFLAQSYYLPRSWNSVLRFAALPSSVSFVATGLSGPFPTMINLLGSKL